MDDFGLTDRFYDMDESDLQVFEDPHFDPAAHPEEDMVSERVEGDLTTAVWFDTLLGSPVLNDCMMSEAASPPFIKSEHSYSVYADEQAGSAALVAAAAAAAAAAAEAGVANGCRTDADDGGVDDEDDGDADRPLTTAAAGPLAARCVDTATAPPSTRSSYAASSATASALGSFDELQATVKCEPGVVSTSAAEAKRSLLRQQQQQLQLRPSSALTHNSRLSSDSTSMGSTGDRSSTLPRISIKVEPGSLAVTMHGTGSSLESPADALSAAEDGTDSLPPTPPGSSSNSDSDGGCGGGSGFSRSPSPVMSHHRSLANGVGSGGTGSSGYSTLHRSSRLAALGSGTVSAAIFSQPIPTSGVLSLTEEEKRTLISEGYPIPTRLPLTKQEERNLKKVRRKIKNKISAQESRRKKKEYVDQLEKRVETLTRDNVDLRKKCDTFQSSNTSLMSQLRRLQALVTKCMTTSQMTTVPQSALSLA